MKYSKTCLELLIGVGWGGRSGGVLALPWLLHNFSGEGWPLHNTEAEIKRFLNDSRGRSHEQMNLGKPFSIAAASLGEDGACNGEKIAVEWVKSETGRRPKMTLKKTLKASVAALAFSAVSASPIDFSSAASSPFVLNLNNFHCSRFFLSLKGFLRSSFSFFSPLSSCSLD